MKVYRNGRILCGLAVVVSCLVLPLTLQAYPIDINAKYNGATVGKIYIDKDGTGIKGTFEVTKKKADGTVMTLAELAAFEGEDHFTWFQKVTSVDPDDPNITDPFVDPPSGGYGGQWADNRPWYWDETVPPNPKPPGYDPAFQLGNNSAGSTLGYFDYPANVPGTQVDFATFLVSDFGNKTYRVHEGFTWSMKVKADGTPEIIAGADGAAFTDEFTAEISEFGWSQVPEPATLLLVTFGMVTCLRKRRAA